MDTETRPFWELLTLSKILTPEAVEQLSTRYRKPSGKSDDPSEIIDLLVSDKVITPFHADVFRAGRHGPFLYGDYIVLDQFQNGPLGGCYSGKHVRAGHRVLIEFVGGDDQKALENWREIKSKVNRLKEIDSHNLIAVHETASIPQHRMIISQRVNGVSLSTKLPRKARLPWEDACGIAAQVSQAISELHAIELPHGQVLPQNIWLTNKGPAMLRVPFNTNTEFSAPAPDDDFIDWPEEYLAPELDENDPATKAGDLYALGCTLHRILRGLPPFYEAELDKKKEAHLSATPGSLEKYQLPKELTNLLDQLLHKDPQKRPKSLKAVTTQLAELSNKPDEVLTLAATPRTTETAFLLALKSDGPDVGKPFMPATEAPEIEQRNELDTTAEARPEWQIKKRSQKKIVPKLVVLSLAGLTAMVVGAALIMDQTKVATVVPETKVEAKEDEKDTNEETSSGTKEIDKAPELVFQAGTRFAQELVADDGVELWETPTVGPLTNFRYLPPSIQVLFTLRPANMLQQREGTRVVRALQDSIGKSTEWLETAAGMEISEMDQLVVAYCSTGQDTYSACYVVRPRQPIARERLVELWRPTITSRDETTGVYENQQQFGYYVIPNPDDPSQALGFAMGPANLMRSISEIAGANTLTGTLSKLSKFADDDRHFTCMAVVSSLFNDEGQALLNGPLAPVALYLRNTLPESVRGVMVSMHLDEGCYLEATVDHDLQTTPTEMTEELRSWMQSLRETVTTNLATASPNPYWDKLRSRFGIQLNELYRNMRVGVEGQDVLVNCWLPEVAAHNLISGSELAVNFAGGQTSLPNVATTKPVPKTLAALLETPRDLSVTTNPDLGLLLSGIKSEILDDYGNLPFNFDIKLMGNDLRTEGITQNQRPGDFEISQRPLSDILAEIMYKANPEKEATGPADPRCKLIWVVAEEPAGSGQPIILITTRAAAADKGYKLPKQFEATQ